MRHRALLALLALALAGLTASAQRPVIDRTVGKIDETQGIATNNWVLRPAGDLVPTDEFPQAVAISPNGRYVAVANAGHGVHSILLVDLTDSQIVQRVTFPHPKAIFRGMAFSADGSKLYVTGGPTDVIREVTINPGETEPQTAREIPLRVISSAPPVDNPEQYAGTAELPDPVSDGVILYPGGLTLSPDGSRLWVSEILGNALAIVNPVSGEVERRIKVGLNPYDVTFDTKHAQAFVSLWGAGAVVVLNPTTGEATARLEVGAQPTGMALDADRDRLYVTCAHSDEVAIINTATREVLARVPVKPYADAPLGSAPTAVVVTPDGGTLYIACAGDNAVAAVTLNAARTHGQVTGRLPAGWYPTDIKRAANGRLLVCSARGTGSEQNGLPQRRYIPRTMIGLLQIIPAPTATDLARGLADVTSFNNWQLGTDVRFLSTGEPSPIPARVGGYSPIRYCVYVIKENRTYDQVFGELPQGRGEPSLTMFGRDVTPNQHRLAEQYVLLDNFYVNGTVSVDGHQWAKHASAGHALERGWGLNYSQRGPMLPGPLRQPATRLQPQLAGDAGIAYKVYNSSIKEGEDLKTTARVVDDLAGWTADGEMPQLLVIHLPNNHTQGTRTGSPTPRAMVAENDLAVGQLVEALSSSPFWNEMAIFICEDDAQDGPDHIDSHRSPALVIGPHVRRGIVDSTYYDQVAMLRTIELILGLQPLSVFDASAMPMWTVFGPEAKPERYQAVVPNQPLDEMNAAGAYGQAWCDAQDWATVDEQPWPEFNRILWAACMGEDAPLPVIRSTRYAMAVTVAGEDDDEE